MTFVDLNKADIFKLKTTQSEIKARGSGPEPIPVHISKHNQLNVGKWMRNNFQLNLIDTIHKTKCGHRLRQGVNG